MTLRRAFVLGFVFVSLGCGGSGGPSSAMSLRRVVLYQNGVGYFERSGEVAQASLPLRFGPHEVDDVLSTLTVLDRAGGQTVVSASVPQRREGEPEQGVVTLDLRLPDASPRDLLVTYAVPTPAWRAAYRVVLPEGQGEGEALFQAWALIHNASPEDWTGVELALATAAPISYRVDLRTPEFVARPDTSGHMSAPTVHGAVVGQRSHPEADGDGIPDATDLCPGEAEDRDGFEDGDGCPEPDNDQDRMLDANDQCPNDPETYNGTDDEDGCPDRGVVVINRAGFIVLDRIYFERGSARIRPRSEPIIEAVARTLAGNPEIARLEVQGHTSRDEPNPLALSSERAAAVRQALIARGVAAERLIIRSLGASQPIASGDSESARERNRNVNFHIAETNESAGRADPAGENAIDVESVARAARPTSAPVTVQGTARYDIAEPITIPARSSALVTILSERVRGEAILFFRPDANAPGSDSHPFRAARISMPPDTTLIPGAVAIYAGGAFAGEALIDSLHEGEVATLPYAIDGSTRVERTDETDREPSRLIAIARGVLTVEDRSVRRTRYVIRPGEHAPSRIFIHHRRTHGHTPRGLPEGTEESARALLIPVAIEGGRPTELVVEETTPVRRQVSMVGQLHTPVAPYVEATGALPAPLREQLDAALELRRALGEHEERVASLHQRLGDAATRSSELRRNLHALGERRTDIRRTLEERLREASDEVERLSGELADAQAQAAEARARLSELIATLTFGG